MKPTHYDNKQRYWANQRDTSFHRVNGHRTRSNTNNVSCK